MRLSNRCTCTGSHLPGSTRQGKATQHHLSQLTFSSFKRHIELPQVGCETYSTAFSGPVLSQPFCNVAFTWCYFMCVYTQTSLGKYRKMEKNNMKYIIKFSARYIMHMRGSQVRTHKQMYTHMHPHTESYLDLTSTGWNLVLNFGSSTSCLGVQEFVEGL